MIAYRSNPLKPFHRNIPLNPVIYIMFMLAGTYHGNSSRGSPVFTEATTFPLVTNDRHCSFRILLLTCFSCSFIDSYIKEPRATTGSPVQGVGSRTKHKITGGSFKHHIVTCSYCVGNSR